jgi:hypothetical protein
MSVSFLWLSLAKSGRFTLIKNWLTGYVPVMEAFIPAFEKRGFQASFLSWAI